MCEFSDAPAAAKLLEWYDRYARDLPWRVSPGDRAEGVVPDPYRVWLSEIMLQQTTVVAVKPYFHEFTSRWPSVSALAAAEDADLMAAWAGLGYYARARNLLKCARVIVAEHHGRFPSTQKELQCLPGIGPYTSAAIAAIAFDQPATVVDGNVERVMARIFAIATPLPDAKPVLTARAEALTPTERPGDYAQAVMDLGATICTPRKPACALCPWYAPCQGRIAGIAETLPTKKPKPIKPTRYGTVYLARRFDGAWLLETRPEKGLLGGMLGWPGSSWSETQSAESVPRFEAEWTPLPGEVRHTFTHFHLRLEVSVARVGADVQFPGIQVVPDKDFDPKSLPTVMRKAHALARDWFELGD
ncbi:MAG: A/G-specific adenine glycosylase [Pseudomonadota bacterium]